MTNLENFSKYYEFIQERATLFLKIVHNIKISDIYPNDPWLEGMSPMGGLISLVVGCLNFDNCEHEYLIYGMPKSMLTTDNPEQEAQLLLTKQKEAEDLLNKIFGENK